jgi:Eco57I restriction-modification methylase/restriction-modification enzyme MmeI-like protein
MAQRRTRIEDRHAEWLSLVETSGPFLTVPVLKRSLPEGLEATPPAASALHMTYDEWRENPALQRRWIQWVLDELLELEGSVAEAGEADPSHRVGEHGTTLRPTFVVRDNTRGGRPTVLLVHVLPAGTPLDRPLPDEVWVASPIDRAAELARATGIELALVTDGARWTLVWARAGETVGICTWRTELWFEEPVTLRAFSTLLGARRFFALPVEESLEALLGESAGRQQEVADQLGVQVRRAVELLIATLDREDRERHGELLGALEGAEVYRGAVTVMMRLVFLFVAEERRLLPINEPRYAETLAASTLRAQLQERADRDGEDPLERSTAAWHRMLALFRAVHGGIEHDGLRLPAYGSGLFDPDRYPFLEGRAPGTRWQDTAAQPLPVDDRTMLHLLDALQALEQQGARVLLSYRALDVEQIGHVYEGLLDHTGVRLSDHALAFGGRKEPELALGQMEGWLAAGDAVLVERLAEETGRSSKAITTALAAELTDERRARLRAACSNDEALLARVAPYHALLREDLRGDPLVLLAGSLFVTQALDRRTSGTYYTPRQLAEEVVKHALDPVVYSPGPAQQRDEAVWRLRPATELLDLKIADIAMGSGAFLVAACRYLAARLQEAWENEGAPTGNDIADAPAQLRNPLPADPVERELLAHRLIAERCLYGVDKNPMAVEMAKLSLWLLTLAKDRPFSFLDHALRAGDSLLGITDLRQLRVMHLDASWHRQTSVDLGIDEVDAAMARALELRLELEAFVVRDPTDAKRKARLLTQADNALQNARLLGDLVVGAAVSQRDDADPFAATHAATFVQTLLDPNSQDLDRDAAHSSLRELAQDWLAERRRAVGNVAEVDFGDRVPFHWALEFPEVHEHGGFDSIVGNPPFQGGKKISGALGGQYRDYLVTWVAGGVRGSADLIAYFYLRTTQLLRPGGDFGLIATNTIAQGDTREVGLDQLAAANMTMYRAIASEPWPGGASLEMATVWARRGQWDGGSFLDRIEVAGITSALTVRSRVEGRAQRIVGTGGRAFLGSMVLGMGFVLSDAEANAMIAADPRNADVVRPYLIGEDLNQRPDGSPSRWVIDFRDWPLERAQDYSEPFERIVRLVKPVRLKLNERGYRDRWWQFGRQGQALYRAIVQLDRCIAITLVSKVVQPMLVPTNVVYAHKLAIFSYDDDAHFGLLSSGMHRLWAINQGSTMRTDTNYSPTDCFETFAQPDLTPVVADLGRALNEHRSALMLDREEGLTTTYNRVHDVGEQAEDIVRLRELHIELDIAVRDAYHWADLDLGHGFHDTRFGIRFTFAPVPRQEVLDRLLELNHERYAEEVRQGLHSKKRTTRKSAAAFGVLALELDGV